MRRLALVVLPLAAVALLGLPLAAGGDGTDEPGFLGFHLEPNPLLSPDRRASIHTEGSEGSVVAVLTPGGPAEVAGLRLGDRVVELGGKTVPDPQTITPKDRASHHEWRVAIRELLEGARAGETVTVVALRGGQRVPVKVTAISEAALRRLQLPEGGAVTIPAPTDAGTPLPLALDLGASVGPLPQGLLPYEGRWALVAAPDATSRGVVLRQDFPVIPWAVALVTGEHRAFSDGVATVRFRPEAGVTDASGGIVFRARDAKNYYVVRANALEENFRLYVVKDGVRTQIGGAEDIPLPPFRAWHVIEVTFRGTSIRATLNGGFPVEVTDETFSSGWTGLWTKADSVTLFDDFHVVPIR